MRNLDTVESVEFRCLKLDAPDQLLDIGVFKIENNIYGPVQVLPLRSNKLDVLNYASIVHHFPAVSTLDRIHIIGTL